MGELILMLLLTCVVCGGIPALAFAYINGKIKFSNHGKTPSEKNCLSLAGVPVRLIYGVFPVSDI